LHAKLCHCQWHLPSTIDSLPSAASAPGWLDGLNVWDDAHGWWPVGGGKGPDCVTTSNGQQWGGGWQRLATAGG